MSGETSNDIYMVAQSLRPAVVAWSKRNTTLQPDLAEEILMDLVVSFIEKKVELGNIQNLPAYLFKSFKFSAYAYLKKNKKVELLDIDELKNQLIDPSQDIERRIFQENERFENEQLLEQILSKLDKKSRFVLHYLMLDLKYKDIVPLYNKKFNTNVQPNFLRSKFHKSIVKAAKLLETKREF